MIAMSTITPFLVLAFLLGALATTAQTRTGLPPQDAWTCPPSHPIKGNFTTSSGEPCLYHIPTGQTSSRFCLPPCGLKPTVFDGRKSSDIHARPLTCSESYQAATPRGCSSS
jgi:hypothetical protein